MRRQGVIIIISLFAKNKLYKILYIYIKVHTGSKSPMTLLTTCTRYTNIMLRLNHPWHCHIYTYKFSMDLNTHTLTSQETRFYVTFFICISSLTPRSENKKLHPIKKLIVEAKNCFMNVKFFCLEECFYFLIFVYVFKKIAFKHCDIILYTPIILV